MERLVLTEGITCLKGLQDNSAKVANVIGVLNMLQ